MNLLSIFLKLCRIPRISLAIVRDRWYGPAVVRASGATHGANLRLCGIPNVACAQGASIVIGENVALMSTPKANPLYLSQPCTLIAGSNARIEIGNGSGFSGVTVFASTDIRIGKRVLLGSCVVIVDSDFHPLDPDARAVHQTDGAKTSPVRIGDDVFVGMRAIILKGVTIGAGAVIGAGSVVSRDIPEGMIAAGNPAKVIGPVKRNGREKDSLA